MDYQTGKTLERIEEKLDMILARMYQENEEESAEEEEEEENKRIKKNNRVKEDEMEME